MLVFTCCPLFPIALNLLLIWSELNIFVIVLNLFWTCDDLVLILLWPCSELVLRSFQLFWTCSQLGWTCSDTLRYTEAHWGTDGFIVFFLLLPFLSFLGIKLNFTFAKGVGWACQVIFWAITLLSLNSYLVIRLIGSKSIFS